MTVTVAPATEGNKNQVKGAAFRTYRWTDRRTSIAFRCISSASIVDGSHDAVAMGDCVGRGRINHS
jgi:hypothetical protein